ncbi:MAG: hypothetical protein ACC628_10105 [Pirellulaceae bacterium]
MQRVGVSPCFSITLVAMFAAHVVAQNTISDNLLRNASFGEGVDESGIPLGWSRYGGGGAHLLEVVQQGAARCLLLEDGDPRTEIGIVQTIPATPGETYEASAEIRAVAEATPVGAYLQLRFLPSNQYFQVSLGATNDENFETISVKGTAPPDTRQALLYVYTHRDPTPKLLVREVRLVSGVTPPPPPLPQPPAPVPPVFETLKELHLSTDLVRAGQASAAIVAPASGLYDEQARRIQECIRKKTGVQLPIETDASATATVPIRGHLIVLGNRSTHRTIRDLYDRYYTLLDLRYPGPQGYVVRTLHNPFGGGHNVVLVGGSDLAGVDRASKVLEEELETAASHGNSLSLGRLARIQLGVGIEVPEDVREMETWDASKGYGSVGYFGWNSLSKQMAMYYMTGKEVHAREFIRLAFPDEQARREISDIDGERIEIKEDPLAGPYHYNAHMMILYWDLIEESPVFTDEERLRVTNAFSRQLNHRKNEGIYGRTSPPRAVGSRHGQWSAVSLYCLGRYFQKDDPNPIWQHCVESARMHFRPLHEHSWINGESDNLFWFNTGIAPVFTYLVLTGEREPLQNGVLADLLRDQEMLISGRQPDWALNAASIGYLHKAAYLTQDGRYLLYRDRTGIDTKIFRLGQSFWPEDSLKAELPTDLVGLWSINGLPKPMWTSRASGLRLDESFQFGSFRSAADASGDFILIDGFNGASRNPYHTFAVLELRLNGYTLLRGYRNQLLTRADGLVEPRIPMDAALQHRDVIGATAVATAEVPRAAYCRWRRTLAQRMNRYALFVDQLVFRADADNMEVQILWETEHGAKTFADGHLEFSATREVPSRETDPGGQIRTSRRVDTTRRGRVATMQWRGPARAGRQLQFFTLVGVQPGASPSSLACFQVDENAAALALPAGDLHRTRPALAVSGAFAGVKADLAIVAEDHLFALGLQQVGWQLAPATGNAQTGPETHNLFTTQPAVDVDWDFSAGTLYVVAHHPSRLRFSCASTDKLSIDGKPFAQHQAETIQLEIPEGRVLIHGATPSPEVLEPLRHWLARQLADGQSERTRIMADDAARPQPSTSHLEMLWEAQVPDPIVDVAVRQDDQSVVYAAAGTSVHRWSFDGKTKDPLAADGPIRMLHWWPEHALLLAGCADEQVIAFNENGDRQWVFTSEMDPAVFQAAKTYWFKSAPGHEGIHGLHTGTFLKGTSQLFVGSACTLEILDEHGKLIRRMPQFWGKVSHFAIIDGPDDSLNLLASRKYNGTNRVAIINNQTLDPDPRGFDSVPSGVTHVGGWSSMNRHHLFYEDLDGDGIKEVMSEINGTWNRVTVWRADGRALYDASFGPGERIPAKNMRDVDVCDLDGDGQQEIVTATAHGLVVALDHQCRKVWATRSNSAPNVLKCIGRSGERSSSIVVGCDNGDVLLLDSAGQVTHTGKILGRPVQVQQLSGSVVLLATDQGRIKTFRLPD